MIETRGESVIRYFPLLIALNVFTNTRVSNPSD